MVSVASDNLTHHQGGDSTGVFAQGAQRELRVLQVFSSLGVGGAETWLMALLKYFHANRNEMPFRVRNDVCLTGGSKAVFDAEAESLGARLFYVHYTRKKLIKFTRDFRRILSDGRYHAIHDHQDYTAGWHFLSGLGLLPPVRIAHVHNAFFSVTTRDKDRVRRSTLRAGKRLLSSLATQITGTSLEILGRYGFDDASYAHMNRAAAHCGFDVSRYRGDYQTNHRDICREFGWQESAKIILFVGRLDTTVGGNPNQKNSAFALEVAKVCIARDALVRMLVVGGGDEARTELETRVKGWGLEREIRLTGIRQDVPRLMLGSDLFLFPSLEEGLGMVAVEAQAAGLRVLASDFVPRESVVIPEVIHFHSLVATVSSWAQEALGLMSLPKPDSQVCNRSVSNSAFSIENSARRLLQLYAGGEPI
jgi:glycosyltransferase involved in cell wall biosynthesis